MALYQVFNLVLQINKQTDDSTLLDIQIRLSDKKKREIMILWHIPVEQYKNVWITAIILNKNWNQQYSYNWIRLASHFGY
jgi:hypothetical protein